MNFCKIYNKSMNLLENVSQRLSLGNFGEYNYITGESLPRKNVTRINIIVGIIQLFMQLIFLILCIPLLIVVLFLVKLYDITISEYKKK